jgi:hypothetical protein
VDPAVLEYNERGPTFLAAALNTPGERLFLLCFGDEEPGTQGPRRVSQGEIREAFSGGWAVEEIRPARFEVRPDLEGISFSEGGPRGGSR